MFNAIQYMLATGCQWRASSKCFPPFTTVQYHFYKWSGPGIWDRMMQALRSAARCEAGRKAEPTAAAIDSQSVKATESGSPRGFDAGKRIKGRKRHITVDAKGFPIVVHVHPANVQDRDGAPAVIVDILADKMVPNTGRLEIEDWTHDVQTLADRARKNDIDKDDMAEYAARSWDGLRKVFPTPVSEAPEEVDALLESAVTEAVPALAGASDTTKKTADVLAKLRETAATFSSGRELPWSAWVRLLKLAPAKSSEHLVRRVTEIASRHPAHPRLQGDLEAYIRGVYQTAAEASKTTATTRCRTAWSTLSTRNSRR